MVKVAAVAVLLGLLVPAESINWLRDFTLSAKRAKVSGKLRMVVFAVDKSGKSC